MKYRVRSKEGELEFPSFKEVEQAWLLGLIEPEDEVLEEGKTMWRKAGTIPLLVHARRSGEQVWLGTWFIWTLLGVAGGSTALWMLHQGDYVFGVLVAVVTTVVMMQVTLRAYQKRKPHG